MPLVEYADSDDSDVGDTENTRKGIKAPTKPTFHKVVDRSNPHKIRVSLPDLSKNTTTDSEDKSEPPSKRAKIDSGGFSGFNSFLPAPKRAARISEGLSNGSGKGGPGGGGVSFKTGATPSFSREAEPVLDGPAEEIVNAENEDIGTESGVGDHTSTGLALAQGDKAVEIPNQESNKKGNPIMFKPLSVARKPQKKKIASPAGGQCAHRSPEIVSSQQAKDISKASLFSIGDALEPRTTPTTPTGEYKPMIYKTSDKQVNGSALAPSINPYHEDTDPIEEPIVENSASHSDAPQSLDTIASDLRLSASAKRQLFGRNGNNPSSINIVNFNTDQEYAANEVLRQNGEQVQHNPVRALAAGKHSLKQLVNAASNQKDALEEQFSSGRRNKREAGSKYGW